MNLNRASPLVTRTLARVGWVRPVAFAGGAILTASYLQVLYRAIDVAGTGIGTAHFLAVVVGSLGLAALVSRVVTPRVAVLLGAALLAGGLTAYLLSVPLALSDLQGLLTDTTALLTGLSILQVTRADVWALGLAPAPVFLTAYFFLRGSYARGVLVGGLALALFVLTGDAGTVQALVGVLGAAGAVGLGDLDEATPSATLQNTLVVVLVGMLVVTTSVSFVPGGEARPLASSGGPATVEASLTDSPARVDMAGSIWLSPEVRFTVAADEGRYWRVGAYDRYTGDAWVRTGRTRPYEGGLSRPPGSAVVPVTQQFTAESAVSTMPATWKPVAVEEGDAGAEVTDMGGLQPRGSLGAGDTYSVRSLVNRPSGEQLRSAGQDYPPGVRERYLQLPESTPARLGEFTTELTADDETPYETAVTVERWLEGNKIYSLSVERPAGDMASAFVFDMDFGYCVYFATAMVAMLRTQDVPARFVVGYTTGQQVDDGRWVVRGLDSHAWVEVYFPGEGWVRFDPTPEVARRATEVGRLLVARDEGEENIDTAESEQVRITPMGAGSFGNNTSTAADEAETPTGEDAENESADDAGAAGAAGGLGGLPTSPEALLYAVVLLLGGITAVVRLGVAERLYRVVWLRRLPPGPPGTRIEAAVERAEYLLGRRFRPRRPGETRRAYLRDLARRFGDDGDHGRHVQALFHLGERARYAGRASEDDAEEAARLLGELRGATRSRD